MFEIGYPFKFYGKKGGADPDVVAIYRYAFRNIQRKCYIIEAHEFPDRVFIIKFYWKHHHLSERKFSLLVGDQYAPKIIRTCAEVCLHLLQEFPHASFGMVASPIEGEKKYFNKRFRIYRSLIIDWFPDSRFHHVIAENQGGYLIINKALPNSEERITSIMEMFIRNYSELITEEGESEEP